MAFIRMRDGLTAYEWDWPYIKGLTVYESLVINDAVATNKFYFNDDDEDEKVSIDGDEKTVNFHDVKGGPCVFGCPHFDDTETPRFLSG